MLTCSKIKESLCIQACTDPMINDKASSLLHVLMMQDTIFTEGDCLPDINLACFIDHCVQHCLSTGRLMQIVLNLGVAFDVK